MLLNASGRGRYISRYVLHDTATAIRVASVIYENSTCILHAWIVFIGQFHGNFMKDRTPIHLVGVLYGAGANS